MLDCEEEKETSQYTMMLSFGEVMIIYSTEMHGWVGRWHTASIWELLNQIYQKAHISQGSIKLYIQVFFCHTLIFTEIFLCVSLKI